VVQVAFEGFGDGGPVAGGEQVEQQSAGDRDGEPGFGPRGLVVQPGFAGDRGRDRGDPGLDRVLQHHGRASGPQAALTEVERLEREGRLAGYHYLPAIKADLLSRLGRPGEAAAAYRQALALAANDAERAFLDEQIAATRSAG